MKTNSMLHPFADVQNQLQKKRQQLMLKRGYLELAKNAAIILIIVLAMGLYDTVRNGLLNGDGYHPVTEQMKEVMGN